MNLSLAILSAFLPVFLIGALQWLMPSLVPATLPFGVRIPGSRADEPVILAARRVYRWGTAVVTVVILGALALFVDSPLAGPIGIAAQLVFSAVLYQSARRRIMAVKARDDWFGGRRQVTVADISLRTRPERFPWQWSLPAFLVFAATAVTGIVSYSEIPGRLVTRFGVDGEPMEYAAKSITSVFGLVAGQLLVTVALCATAAAVLRSRPQLDAENPSASAEQHRRFVSVSARALLAMAACLNATFLIVALATWDVLIPVGSTGFGISLTVALLGTFGIVAVLIRTGQSGRRLRVAATSAGDPKTVNRDDDRLYRWGVFYYNTEDPALLVPKRFGIGWTLNMARPLAWLILIIPLVIEAAAPVLSHFTG